MARLLSIVGHPLVLLCVLMLVLHAHRNPERTPMVAAAVALIVLLPLCLLIWRSRASGRWQTVDASDKADRPVLYLAIGLVLVAAAGYFQFVEHSPDFVRGCAVIGGMMLAAFVLNCWIKLSLHVTFATFCGLVLSVFHFREGPDHPSAGAGPDLVTLGALAAYPFRNSGRADSRCLGGELLALRMRWCPMARWTHEHGARRGSAAKPVDRAAPSSSKRRSAKAGAERSVVVRLMTKAS